MEVGNGMSSNEDRAHFSMWCMLAAPLIAGNDLSKMSDDVKNILTDKDAIAINQDLLGVQGFKYSSKDSLEIWFKPLANDDWAMCVLNRDAGPQKISFNWNDENVFDDLTGRSTDFKTVTYQLKDLWKKQNVGNTKNIMMAVIPGHDVLMLRLIKIKE